MSPIKHFMSDVWANRYGVAVWWIALRYFSIGLEYLLQIDQSRFYWVNFGTLNPSIIGAWLVAFGLLGILSRVLCRKHIIPAAGLITYIFVIGSLIYSLFRIAIFVQMRQIGDPLLVLFACDFGLMFTAMVQLHKPRLLCR